MQYTREPALELIYEKMYDEEQKQVYSDTNPHPNEYSWMTDPWQASNFAQKFITPEKDLIQKIPKHVIETIAKNPSAAQNWLYMVTDGYKLPISYPVVHQEIINSIATDPEISMEICKSIAKSIDTHRNYSSIPLAIKKVGEERRDYWAKRNRPPQKRGILHSINKTLFGG